jgi:predicted transposase YdaD
MASAPLIHLKIDNLRNALVDLIETILVYKFPNRTKEEIIAMLGTDDLKKPASTRTFLQKAANKAANKAAKKSSRRA